HAYTAGVICAHRPEASVSICDGGCADTAAEIFCAAGANRVSRAPFARALARARDGRHFATAVNSRSTRQSCGDAHGESAGEFKLHRVERDAGLLRKTMPIENGDFRARLS